MIPSQKIISCDERFDQDESKTKYNNYIFTRLVAKEITFKNVEFKYCTFDSCYLRKCTFIGCDFTGSRFTSSNLTGSTFTGCEFPYTTYEKTLIDDDVLSSNCPGYENQKAKFARALRINFQQLGDAASANRAIGVELDATREHLYKAWHSNESYYRKKYKSIRRGIAFLDWTAFKALDFLWGNGESALKLLRSLAFVLLGLIVIDSLFWGKSLLKMHESLLTVPSLFMGNLPAADYHPSLYVSFVAVIRLVFFGLFMAILIKRLNRR